MAAEPRAELALRLQDAKEALEDQLRDAVRTYEHDHPEPLEVTVNFEHTREIGGDDDAHGELKSRIETLIEAFLAHPAVREAGVDVRRVTAIDSDADGEVAVNVKYEYAV